ncbi:hypothetical protein [Sphingomonas sp. PWP1-2]|uniref:hypothetical protein n=1 Tax=Sphingomonas sp. PWP1-2 TaxID=2804558 RepID=UPI003CEE96AB
MLIDNVEYPAYVASESRFGVLRGLVLVLTHECDLEQDNSRVMNDAAIICPVIPLEAFVENLEGVLDDNAAGQLLSHVTARNVNRLVYIPVIADFLPMGGYLYLNLLSHTHLSKLIGDNVTRVCMTSPEGLREIDLALERHLRRPKDDRMPFQPYAPAPAV